MADKQPYRCINQRCTRKNECEFGVRNQRAHTIFGEDLDGLRRYCPKTMNPVAYHCTRFSQA